MNSHTFECILKVQPSWYSVTYCIICSIPRGLHPKSLSSSIRLSFSFISLHLTSTLVCRGFGMYERMNDFTTHPPMEYLNEWPIEWLNELNGSLPSSMFNLVVLALRLFAIHVWMVRRTSSNGERVKFSENIPLNAKYRLRLKRSMSYIRAISLPPLHPCAVFQCLLCSHVGDDGAHFSACFQWRDSMCDVFLILRAMLRFIMTRRSKQTLAAPTT